MAPSASTKGRNNETDRIALMFAAINYLLTTSKGTRTVTHLICTESGDSRGFRVDGGRVIEGDTSAYAACAMVADSRGEDVLSVQYASASDVDKANAKHALVNARLRLSDASRERDRLTNELSDYIPGSDDEARADILADLDAACAKVASARACHRELAEAFAGIANR